MALGIASARASAIVGGQPEVAAGAEALHAREGGMHGSAAHTIYILHPIFTSWTGSEVFPVRSLQRRHSRERPGQDVDSLGCSISNR